MKKLIILFLTIMFITTGCTNTNYNGKETTLSKMFLDKGYTINIYRSSEELSSNVEDFGKSYININYNILAEYTSTAAYNMNANYNIKKVIVNNVRVISTSKMGTVGELAILKRYSGSTADSHVDVVGTSDKYVENIAIPNTSGYQIGIMVELNKIALYDQNKYTNISYATSTEPTLEMIYDKLGIDSSTVRLKIGFRIELLTVDNITLYKDYEITVPPTGVDIKNEEFHYEYYQTDVKKMAPFLQK